MPTTILTNDSGRWISQQIIESLTEPDWSYLESAGLGLTDAQKEVITANNKDYLYMTFGRPQSWNGSSELKILTYTPTLNASNSNIIFSSSVSDNVAANDLLTFYTANTEPFEILGPFLVTNVNSAVVSVNAQPTSSGNNFVAVRTRNHTLDNVAPNVMTSYTGTIFNIWSNMIGGKILTGADFAHVVPRHDWTANTVYTKYNTYDPDLFSKPFYVLTSEYKVYKCLDNYGNSPSTVEPSEVPSLDWKTPIVTSDGYVWKYMFSLDENDTNFTQKFLTDDYMPVKVLDAEASEPINQWSVQEAAVDGAIDNIIVINSGSGYVIPSDGPLEVHFVGGGGEGAEGQAIVVNQEISSITVTQEGSGYGTNISRTFTATVNSMILLHSGNNISNTYNGSYISGNVIPANTYITAIENGSTPKKVYISANATSNGAVGGATISGIPRIVIQNGGGSNAVATAVLSGNTVDSVTIVDSGEDYVPPIVISIFGDGDEAQASVANDQLDIDGCILGISVDDPGEGYSNSTVTISGGKGANARAIVMASPPGGHGSDPVSELGAKNLMLSVALDGDESGNLAVSLNNDYRQVALLLNPYKFGTTLRANATTFMQTKEITVTPGITNFEADEIVYQEMEDVDDWVYTAVVEYFDPVTNSLYVVNTFRYQAVQFGDTPLLTLPLKGRSSNAFRNMINQNDPYLEPLTGKILFVQNFVPIVRDSAQTEYIRMVLAP